MASWSRCVVVARIRVFVGCGIHRPQATHQTPLRIKALYGPLALRPGIRPLAHLVPQQTLGSLPCPRIMGHFTWLFPLVHSEAGSRQRRRNTRHIAPRPLGMG
jgi:hypothetical protein